jgi:hypothetical protein
MLGCLLSRQLKSHLFRLLLSPQSKENADVSNSPDTGIGLALSRRFWRRAAYAFRHRRHLFPDFSCGKLASNEGRKRLSVGSGRLAPVHLMTILVLAYACANAEEPGSWELSEAEPTPLAAPTSSTQMTEPQQATAYLVPTSTQAPAPRTTPERASETMFNPPASPTAAATIPAALITPVLPNEAVFVEVGASSFARATPIRATIQNRLSGPVYGLSGQSFCTILDVQKLEGGEWKSQARCVAGAPPVPIRIEPNSDIVIELEPKLANEQPLEPRGASHRLCLSRRFSRRPNC